MHQGNLSTTAWKTLGILTATYLVIAILVTAILVATGDFHVSPIQVDWSLVPANARVPLWLAQSHVWFPAIAVATAPAPVGFFRRAAGKPAGGLLRTYSTATFLLAFAMVGAPSYLSEIGSVRTSATSWVVYDFGSVIGSAVPAILLAIPAFVALRGLDDRIRIIKVSKN